MTQHKYLSNTNPSRNFEMERQLDTVLMYDDTKFGEFPLSCVGDCEGHILYPYDGIWESVNGVLQFTKGNTKYVFHSDYYMKFIDSTQICPDLWTWNKQTGEWIPLEQSGKTVSPVLVVYDQFLYLMTKLIDIPIVIPDIKTTKESLKAKVTGCQLMLENHSCTMGEHLTTLIVHSDVLKLQDEKISSLQSDPRRSSKIYICSTIIG
ncbi:hypothetical protein HHI36_001467 [Cryptolaemus montrouzieri]|uniref:Uncharacterized protein n=1 Tax=Cryptolaemus montrouzieri TaxID=559131 RepID=A0ABD2P7R2_9CUCU